MDLDGLDAASQAQLAAFLLATSSSSHQSQAAPLVGSSNLHFASNPAWDTTELNNTDLDTWWQQQLNTLNVPPPPPPPPPSNEPAPAQPHAFPPISSSRFHPYDRQQQRTQYSSTMTTNRWQPIQPSSSSSPVYPILPHQPIRQPVLYPPDDSPAPIILSNVTSPRSVPTHSAFPTPTSTTTSVVASPAFDSSSKAQFTPSRRRRTRSLPTLSTKDATMSKEDALDQLFSWMDEKRWNLSGLLTALSERPGDDSGKDLRKVEHRRRVEDFLEIESKEDSLFSRDEGSGRKDWVDRLRQWKKDRGIERDRGADEIVRMWEEQGGLGRQHRAKGMEDAVKELHLNVHDGHVAGSAIRSVINRYHEAYNESQADIARLDAALSRPPSPHLSSAPREPTAWSGLLVVPPTQADLLSHWLMSPGRPNLQEERAKGSIEAEHMRIYSSLSPLDLQARGAEVCRAILARDESTHSRFGRHWDSIHLFSQGPSIAPFDTVGFAAYDDYSLWHHALMCYLQLCVRYPAFRDSQDAHVVLAPDLPPPIHPTPLETSLIDRLLKSHWDYLRLYLLNEHGGLLRSAVRGFEGVKLSRYDLLSVVGDTMEVIEALKKSRDSNDRILPYDPSVSQVRNAWRQRAFWDPQASWVAWSAATTHFLELSALNKEWASGVRDLPGLESFMNSTSKTASSQALL